MQNVNLLLEIDKKICAKVLKILFVIGVVVVGRWGGVEGGGGADRGMGGGKYKP